MISALMSASIQISLIEVLLTVALGAAAWNCFVKKHDTVTRVLDWMTQKFQESPKTKPKAKSNDDDSSDDSFVEISGAAPDKRASKYGMGCECFKDPVWWSKQKGGKKSFFNVLWRAGARVVRIMTSAPTTMIGPETFCCFGH